MKRHLATALLTVSTVLVAAAPHADAGPGPAAPTARLTNLDHLDFLGDTVTPPQQDGHTTYRLDSEPSVGTLWTYADHRDDGSFKRVGGGTYDPARTTGREPS